MSAVQTDFLIAGHFAHRVCRPPERTLPSSGLHLESKAYLRSDFLQMRNARGIPCCECVTIRQSDAQSKNDQAVAIALTRAVSLETFRLAVFFGSTPFWAVRASSGSAVFIAASAAD